MSDTNAVALRAIKEVAFGVVPTAPSLQEICFTGAPGLAFAPETTTSEKIRSDRQIDDLPLVGGEAAGDINSELAFDVHDLFLEGAFFNTFQARLSLRNNEDVTQITAVDTAPDEFTVTDEGILAVVDDIVRAEGFTNSGNNGFHIVNGSPTTTTIPVASTLVDESSPPVGAKLRVVGRRAAASDIVATATPDGLTSTILDFTTLGLQVGDWIKLNGSGGTWPAANNDYVRIITLAANVITFDIVPSGWVANDGASATVDIFMAERLINGVSKFSYTVEEEFTDHTPVTFQYFRGLTVDGMSITAEPQSIVTINFTFSGKDGFFSDTANPASVPDELPAVAANGRVASAITLALGTVGVLNSSSDVGRIARGGVPIAGSNFVLEASIDIANNLRQQNAVGFLGAVNIGVGEFGVTGTLNTYFDDATLARDVVSNAETSFDIRFEDNSAHVVLIDVPRIKFSEGSPDVPSKNADVTLPLSYQAIRQPTFNYTLAYFRFNGVQ